MTEGHHQYRLLEGVCHKQHSFAQIILPPSLTPPLADACSLPAS